MFLAFSAKPITVLLSKNVISGVADCGMKMIVLCSENPCREVKFYVSTSNIHTSIQQRKKYFYVNLSANNMKSMQRCIFQQRYLSKYGIIWPVLGY
jgi:hypothetical protein